MRKFTPKEDRMIRKLYLTTPAKRISKILGRSGATVRQRMKVIGITVPPEVVERFKQESRFKSGHNPANKGLKQSEFMSKEGIEKTKRTRFGVGHLPHNTKHDGAISIRNDKSGASYRWIRIEKAKWKMYHVYLWEKKHGAVPKGSVVVFKDRDSMNCKLSNLMCITREENMRRNSYWLNLPKDVAQVIQLRGALNRQINKHIKTLTNEEQNQRSERSYVRTTRKTGRRKSEKRGSRKRDTQS